MLGGSVCAMTRDDVGFVTEESVVGFVVVESELVVARFRESDSNKLHIYCLGDWRIY